MANLNLQEIYTSFLVALLLGSILFGLTIGQTLWYFTVYPKDLKWHLGLVGSLFILDVVHVSVLSIACFYSVLDWMDLSKSVKMMNWSLPASIALTYILTFSVQTFFLVRIWILSRRNKLLSLSIGLFTTVQLASGLVAVAEAVNLSSLDISQSARHSATIELGSSFIADLAITVSLVYYLNRGRSAMDYATATNSVLNRLILFAISTGLLTSVSTLANLALFLNSPDSFIWVIPHVISSKLYVNSLLATLNSRRSVRDIINHRNSCLAQFSPRPPSQLLSRMSFALKLNTEETSGTSRENDKEKSGEKAREYDPNVDYTRDLLPASPQLDASAHDAVETQRGILANLDTERQGRPSPERKSSAPAIDVCIPSGSLSSSFPLSQMSSSPPGIEISDAFPASESPIVSPRSERTQSMIWSPLTPTQSLMRRISSLSAFSRMVPSLHSSRLSARTYNTNTHTMASTSRRGSASPSIANFPFHLPSRGPMRTSSTRHASVPASSIHDNFISFSSIASATHRNSAWASRGSGPNLFVDGNSPPPVPDIPDLPTFPKLLPTLGRDKDRSRGRQRTFSGSSAPGSEDTHSSATVSVNYAGALGSGAAIVVSGPRVASARNSTSVNAYRLPIGPSASTPPNTKRSSFQSARSRVSRSRDRKSSSSLKASAQSPGRNQGPPLHSSTAAAVPMQPWYSPSLTPTKPHPVANTNYVSPSSRPSAVVPSIQTYIPNSWLNYPPEPPREHLVSNNSRRVGGMFGPRGQERSRKQGDASADEV